MLLTNHTPHRFMAVDVSRRHDPTGTTTIRGRYQRDMERRFRRVRVAIIKAVGTDDILDLGSSVTRSANDDVSGNTPPPKAFAFMRKQDKVSAFMAWLKTAEDENILSVMPGTPMQAAANASWQNTYIDSAYQKGIRDAGAKLRSAGTVTSEGMTKGGVSQLLGAQERLAREAMVKSGATYGTSSTILPTGETLYAQVTPRQGNSRGAARGGHLKTQFSIMAPGEEFSKKIGREALEVRLASVAQSTTGSLIGQFNAPIHADAVGLIYTRAYTGLKGITEAMDTQISRVLAQGMIEGRGPMDIARRLANSVDGIGIVRARTLARTETIGAHAEATLNMYEEAGITGVEVEAEFSTAGDDAVCEECDALSGQVYTIEESHGVIPVHVNCRCAWLPVVA